MIKALVESGKFHITAITRTESESTFPSTIQVRRGNYDSEGFLKSSFRDQEVLIIILATTAPKDLQSRLIKAATMVSVPWILPCEFGPDTGSPAMNMAVSFLGSKKQFRDQIEASGSSNWIAVVNGLWFDFVISLSYIFQIVSSPSAEFGWWILRHRYSRTHGPFIRRWSYSTQYQHTCPSRTWSC